MLTEKLLESLSSQYLDGAVTSVGAVGGDTVCLRILPREGFVVIPPHPQVCFADIQLVE